ncbi:MAG: hypothetical protein ACRYGP_17815 [Janthinobacterium lividum]
MAPVNKIEMSAGLNLYLDIPTLKACTGCVTNAASNDFIVNRFGPFLLLEKRGDGWLTVPLFTQQLDDDDHPIESDTRVELTGKKTGPGKGWHGRKSFFSTVQFWIIPEDCLVQASHLEMNSEGNRQRYAEGQPEAIASIIAHETDSSYGFQPFSN